MTKPFLSTLSTIATTLVLTSISSIIPSIALADAKPDHPRLATIKRLTSGDRACYVEIVDLQGQLSTQFAEFSICQEKRFIGERAELTYKPGNILAASCQGNVDCGKTDPVMLITKMRLAGATSGKLPPFQSAIATIESKTFTFTRGKKEQGFPDYKQATVKVPTITHGPNPMVLKRVQTAIAPKQVLGESLQELESEFQQSGALSSLRYQVNYNKNSIVHLTYIKETVTAYPSTFRHYVAVDLQTGKVMTATDLFTPAGIEKMTAKINQSLQKRIQKTIAEKGTSDSDLKTRLAGKQFKPQNLNTFVIREKGITFIYDFDFPHVIRALAPDREFVFNYHELQPFFKAGVRLGR